MAECFLLSLPDELVAAIASYISVGDLLSFALASKDTYRHTRDRLRDNRALHAQYRVQHDRSPLTVPQLLRLVLEEQDAAWHLRSFESWGVRPGFDKWKTWRWHRDDWPEPEEDHSNLDESYFKVEEGAIFEDIMESTLLLKPGDVQFWMDQVGEGWDEPLKTMLFALATFDRLNFIAYDSWQGDEFHHTHPFSFFCLAIRSVHEALTEGLPWPPGFQSLRKVSVCTTTTLRHPHDAYYASSKAIAPLFLLPNIKILNLTLVGASGQSSDESDDEKDEEHNPFPVRASSVEDLAFSVCDLDMADWRQILQAPRKLLNFTISGDGSSVLKVLSEFHGETIECLSSRGYGTTNSCFKQFPTLKQLNRLSVGHLLQGDRECFSDIRFRPTKTVRFGEASVEVTIANLRETLPFTLESLAFEPNEVHEYPESKTLKMRKLVIRSEMLQAIAELAEDPRFENMQEVCLLGLPGMDKHYPYDGSESAEDTAQKRPGNLTDEDHAAIDRIESQGIDTHLQYRPLSEEEKDMVHAQMHRDGNQGLTINESDPTLDAIRDNEYVARALGI